jgi:hypothetical protein
VALAIDGSTPAVVTSSSTTVSTLSTASFTPPASALLLNLWAGNSHVATNPSTPTITDNLGGHLTYTLTDWQSRANSPTVDGQAAAWWANVGSSAAMTVTTTINVGTDNEKQQALGTIVLTDSSTPTVGAHGKSGSTSAASIAQNYTATATGSWGFIVVCDWDALGSMTAGTGCTLIGTGTIPTTQISYGIFRRTTADGTNGGTTTLNVNLAGTSTHVSWVYVEVVPAVTATATSPGPLTVSGVRRPGPAGSALILGSTAVSRDAQPAPWVTGAPPGVRGQLGSAVIVSSQAPSRDFQQPANVIGVASRPPATGSAQILASRAAPPPPTDTPPPALAATPLRPARPAGAAVVLASQAPSADAQPEPFVVVAGRWPVLPGSAAVLWSRADPVVQTDSQPRPLIAAPLRPVGPGSSLIVSQVSPSLDAQPAPVLVRAGILPVRRGSALLVNSVAQPLSPTLAPVTVTSFTIPRPRPAAGVLLLRMASDFAVCTTARPFTGTTSRPGSGTTTYALATTARPNSGTTARPNTGTTEDPC